MNIKDKFIFLFCEIFGSRDTRKHYLGHGDYNEERGWWIFGKWVSAEQFIKKPKK